MTGVDVTPSQGSMSLPETGVSPDFSSETCHSGVPLP
jgi:hypothetical protein